MLPNPGILRSPLTSFPRTGAIYSHTAAKLVFFRFFRHTHHIYTHTTLGWTIWIVLCFASVAIAFVLATAVPIFSFLTGIIASLFASWYTYGIAGFFWLHDTYHLDGGRTALRRRWSGTAMAVFTILAGSFMSVAGTYVSIKVSRFVVIDDVTGLTELLVDCGCVQKWSCWKAVHVLSAEQ